MNEISFQQKLGKLIFLSITKELIRNYGNSSIFRLNKIIENEKVSVSEKKEEIKEEIKEKFKEIIKDKEELDELVKNERFIKTGDEKYLPFPTPTFDYERKEAPFVKKIIKKPKERLSVKGIKLSIPETRLPEAFNYLKPYPLDLEISLGKLDSLLQDPNVKIIECNGSEEEIVVKGDMGEQKTNISLDNQEIEEIINTFSQKTRIPVHEGVYKVVFGRYIFTAIISETIGSRFLIKKMKSPQAPVNYQKRM